MTKKEIIESLALQHKLFSDRIYNLTDSEFLATQPDKWSSGQQLDHIVRSVTPLAKAFSIPKDAPNFIFGSTNRASITYEEMVKKYQAALKNGGKATGRFLPDTIEISHKEILLEKLDEVLKLLNAKINTFSETELNEFTVPHPLLGTLSLREMLYFTIYHVQHHHQLMLRYLVK